MGVQVVILFLALIGNRLCAAIRNGGEYASMPSYTLIGVTGLIGSTVFTTYKVTISQGWFFMPDMWQSILSVTGCIATILIHFFAVLWNDIIDEDKWWTPAAKDLSLLTLSESIILSLVAVLSGWSGLVAIVLSVFPAWYIYEGFVNLLTDRSFHYDGTDDEKVPTYAIPLLSNKLPRTIQKTRLILSVVSVLLLMVIYFIF